MEYSLNSCGYGLVDKLKTMKDLLSLVVAILQAIVVILSLYLALLK